MMRAFRSWPWLVVLYVAVDLADPGTHGVFSLLRHDLFVLGLTGPCGGVDARPVRNCARPPVPLQPLYATAHAAPSAARAAQREPHVDDAQIPRHIICTVAASSLDAEEH